MRWSRRRDEPDAVEDERFLSGVRDRQVAVVNGIERAAEEPYSRARRHS
jgi:hypothetical protein